MKPIQVQVPIQVEGVNPDNNYKPFANVDAKYGPYTDLNQAKSVLSKFLTKGLTIGVIENNQIVEYWIKDDTNEFVIKNQGGNTETEEDSKVIMICLGDTHRTGDYDEKGNMKEYITVTKSENLQRNIKAYEDITYCVNNNKPFSVILDNYTLAKELGSPYEACHFIPECVYGYNKNILGDDYDNVLIELGYDPNKYANTILYLFYLDGTFKILLNDGIVVTIRLKDTSDERLTNLEIGYRKTIKRININDLKQIDLSSGESTHTIQLPIGDIFIYDDNGQLDIYSDNGSTLCTLLPNHIYRVVASDYKDANNNIIKYAKDLLIDDRANGGFFKVDTKINFSKKVNYIQHKASKGELNLKIDRTNLFAGNEYKIIIENIGEPTDDDFKVEIENELIDWLGEENLPVKCLTPDGTIKMFIPPTGILVLNLLIYEQNYTLKGLITYNLTSNVIISI